MAAEPLIRFEHISKAFGGVQALAGVSFDVAAGSTHALMGENGAGKTTLGNILGGIHRPGQGRVVFAGRTADFHEPRDALRQGVAIVHQELAFCPDLTVAENLCLGDLPRRGLLVDRAALRARARARLGRIGVDLDVDQPIGALSTGHKQLVQIAHAVGAGARVIVFDEPTSALTQAEAERLFALIDRLKRTGVTMVYVSHRLPEIARLCDTVTVLRDGRHVATGPIGEFSDDRIVHLMAGRAVARDIPAPPAPAAGEGAVPRLALEGLSVPGAFSGVSLAVHAGEIVGLAGLVGAGRSEIARAAFGLLRPSAGTIRLDGRAVRIRCPRDAMQLGVGFLPEDRKLQGLVLSLAVARNIALASLPELSRAGVVSLGREQGLAAHMAARLRIKAHSLRAETRTLSGGNQQKVALARWLARDSRVLLLDEPTRGVDVASKAEIQRLIARLAAEGRAVLLVSSELPEIVALAHRIVVMRGGRQVGEIARGAGDETDLEERVLRLMTGVER
ncbi:MAG: sugar ABC transporter ATP-binding protein [Planctomycetes bacterium]|nr:sugar ABC transporter ATP-binding protein [Planctomycetota bacterium]